MQYLLLQDLLLSFADEILVKIFQYLEMHDVIQNVRATCRRFKYVIDSYGELWKYVSLPQRTEHVSMNEENLFYVLQFSSWFEKFDLPYAI